MSFRRRHRWLRRLALALALATAVSAGRVSIAAAEYGGPLPSGASLSGVVVRPDDRASRFSHSDAAPKPELAGNGGPAFERGEALLLVIGGSVLALGLGLALGYLRRPRLAGF
jgi:hypothetical protein